MARQRSADRSTARAVAAELEGSLRLCAATRVSRTPDELIRFVASPDGGIVPDLARRLPGRGVWVGADRESIGLAVRAKAFARSLKGPVAVPADLPEQVDRLMERRLSDALALANKAGLVLTGFEKIDRKLASGSVYALVHGSDAAEGGRDKLDRKFLAVSAHPDAAERIITLLKIEQMSLAIGRSNVVHAALIKGGATERFMVEAGRLQRYRSGLGRSAIDQIPPISTLETETE
ncbi:MAG: RNA-binding protein [Hyphomicrobiaceae bacterium]|nr:RNA-binding protein [Hyphomicrobiaceae bacterium]